MGDTERDPAWRRADLLEGAAEMFELRADLEWLSDYLRSFMQLPAEDQEYVRDELLSDAYAEEE